MSELEQGRFVKTRQPCDACGSSDAYAEREDGSGKCFSCDIKVHSKQTNNKQSQDTIMPVNNYSLSVSEISGFKSYPITSRGISQEVVDHFNVKMSVDQDGRPESHFYPYTKDGKVTACKERKLPKDFRVHGDFKDVELFGQAQAVGNKTLVVTEGEIDAMSVAQAYKDNQKGVIYPVVALQSASGVQNAMNQRKFFSGFEKIILMLDNDDAGIAAQEKLARHLPSGKVYIAKLPEKDANETLMKHGSRAIISAFWGAQPWSPAGIVVGEGAWEQYKARQAVQSIPYPDCIDGLNRRLKGMRQGEITLFTSGTGSGKSTVIKEIILNLLENSQDSVGLISLEESVGDTVEKFIGMQMKKSVFDLNESNEAEQREAYVQVFGENRLVLLDHQGSVGDSSLLDNIEHLCAMGCKYLVLDHITIAVSEGTGGKSGNEAMDSMMSDLLKIVKKHNVWLGLISHLRKAQGGKEGSQSFEEGKLASVDDIKGSGSIKQISFDIVSFARNQTAEDETEKNTVQFRVLKSRYTGDTGMAGAARYDINTGRLTAVPMSEIVKVENVAPQADFGSLNEAVTVDNF